MTNTIKRCWIVGLVCACCYICDARSPDLNAASAFVSFTRSNIQPLRNKCCKFSSLDIDVPSSKETGTNKNSFNQNNDNNLLIWKDILPISLFGTICLAGAVLISTYEDYDVTHVRPSPSTLRLPNDISNSRIDAPMTSNNKFNFIGAATKGMGSGRSDRLAETFDAWYGTSATTLQGVRGYNEIMLEHRRETIPKWTGQNMDSDTNLGLMGTDTASRISFATSAKEVRSYSKEELREAVLQLYKSLDEIDNLKTMADDYMWEEIKDMLQPSSSTVSGNENTLRQSFESLEILKSAPQYYKSTAENTNQQQQLTSTDRNNVDELPELIGFDWGSCAWRHCGAKADAQEALAELYTTVGMLEPFECRFIIDIMERSMRDVLLVVPDDLRPIASDGRMVELKPYEPYVSQADQSGGDESMGIDFEYMNALNSLREIFE